MTNDQAIMLNEISDILIKLYAEAISHEEQKKILRLSELMENLTETI